MSRGHPWDDIAPEADNGTDRRAAAASSPVATDAVRDLVTEHRAQRPRTRAGQPAGATASADAVEAVRRSVRDLKHDVRMLKVGLDKQGQLLEYIATRLERDARSA